MTNANTNATATYEICTYYGTDVDTFYVDSQGTSWLIQSADYLPSSEQCAVPADAVKLGSYDESHIEAANEIEQQYR